jgi:hypothetical protein
MNEPGLLAAPHSIQDYRVRVMKLSIKSRGLWRPGGEAEVDKIGRRSKK